MLEISSLSLAPGGLGLAEAVAARRHDVGDGPAELVANQVQRLATPLVLRRIVQERGDPLVLGRTGLEDDRRHAQQVPEVWNAGSLARLAGVQLEGEL